MTNMINKALISLLVSASLALPVLAAEEINFVSSTSVQGLKELIAQIKPKTDVPVIFPTVVPKNSDNNNYFASSDPIVSKYGINYRINVDATKECQGARYCNIGFLTAERSRKVQIYRDRVHKEITTPVKLSNNITGYYTPGHPMGDYFSPNIQWINKKVLYTLSWNPAPGLSESAVRELLIKLANSAIQSEE